MNYRFIDKNSSKNIAFLLLLTFIALCVVLYFPIIKAEPFWDDWIFIFVRQRHIFDTSNPINFIKSNLETRSWPVFYSFLWILIKIFKDHYFLYHLTSIGLHAINCFSIYFLFKKLNFKFPFLLSLIYLAHPANLYTVSWIIQIKTLLSIFFILLSSHCLISFHQSKKYIYFIGVILFYLVSVFSKATTVGFVFVLAAYTYFNRRSFSKIFISIAMFISITISVVATFQTAKFYKIDINQSITRDEEIIKNENSRYLPSYTERFAVSLKNLNRYTSFLFYPEKSQSLFQVPTKLLDNRLDIIGFLFFFTIYLSLFYYCFIKKQFNHLYSLIFYFSTLIPFTGIIFIPIFISSNFIPYWLSIPLIGFIPFLTLFLTNQKALYTLVTLIFIYTHSQTYLLSSPENIFLDSINNSPKNFTYPVALIEHYIFTGQCEKARRSYINYSSYLNTKLEYIEIKIFKCVSRGKNQ